jgi:AmiR/NasT family two-component response regulator
MTSATEQQPEHGSEAGDALLLRETNAAALRTEVLALRAQLETMEKALETRTLIGQATGLIMASTGLDDDSAFKLLVAESQHTNIKLRDLAAEQVARFARRAAS